MFTHIYKFSLVNYISDKLPLESEIIGKLVSFSFQVMSIYKDHASVWVNSTNEKWVRS